MDAAWTLISATREKLNIRCALIKATKRRPKHTLLLVKYSRPNTPERDPHARRPVNDDIKLNK